MLTVPFRIAVLSVLLTVLHPTPARAQEDLTQGKAHTDAFFSGNVIEVSAGQVTVARTVLGKPPETRIFKITVATKIEGKMKQKSRVTVRYATGDEGDVAISIIVRAEKTDNNNKKK